MLKHVGRMANNKRRVVVAYNVLPGDPDNCVVVTTENLEAGDHDALMKTVESAAGQEANNLADVMLRTTLADGSNMLARFHTTGKMIKVPTNTVEMQPNRNTSIMLNELNEAIAQQQAYVYLTYWFSLDGTFQAFYLTHVRPRTIETTTTCLIKVVKASWRNEHCLHAISQWCCFPLSPKRTHTLIYVIYF